MYTSFAEPARGVVELFPNHPFISGDVRSKFIRDEKGLLNSRRHFSSVDLESFLKNYKLALHNSGISYFVEKVNEVPPAYRFDLEVTDEDKLRENLKILNETCYSDTPLHKAFSLTFERITDYVAQKNPVKK